MGQLGAFRDLIDRVRGRKGSAAEVDFALVYIAEAHPTDGWMYPAVERFAYRRQHTRLEDRLQAARVLRTKVEGKTGLQVSKEGFGTAVIGRGVLLLADDMTNDASIAFGALPERLAIVLNGDVRFIGGKGPEEYSMADAAAALVGLTDALSHSTTTELEKE